MKLSSFLLKPFLAGAISMCAMFIVSGCGGSSSNSNNSVSNAANNATSDATFDATSRTRTATDANALTIISPHGKEIQVEFERGFKTKFPDAKFKWIDQGGSSEVLRYVLQQFKGKTAKEGIGIDVYFGGGADAFGELESARALQTLNNEYSIPAQINGAPLRGKDNQWVAAALSGFGILANKSIMQRDGLPLPQTWSDLGNPKLRGRIALADPRQSGSAHMAYEIILQANGWDKGWKILTQMAGNANAFGKSSSRLLEDVASGEAVAAPAIDFYALSKVGGANGKLQYIEPQSQRVITADPIGVLRGAPNTKMARDFVAFVMSPNGQKLWMLQKGANGGPQNETLYRLAALPTMYKPIPAGSVVKNDPYAGRNSFSFDSQKSAQRRRALDDIIGAALIDNLRDVQKWTAKNPNGGYVPIGEADFMKQAAQSGDDTKRNALIGAWNQKARAFFQTL